jgi:cellulose synthase/poly-beta-1,6-N-acetylglucosamine synthase-like glycosyltransferase
MTQLQSSLTSPEKLANGPAAPGAAEDRGTGPWPDRAGARRLLSRGQVALAVILAGCAAAVAIARAAAGLGPPLLWWAGAAVAVLTVVYVAVLAFGFVGVLAAPRLRPRRAGHPAVADHELPVFTVLVPLSRAGAHLDGLFSRLCRLHYPADRLQVLLLVGDGDEQARTALGSVSLGPQFQVVPVPSGPQRRQAAVWHAGLGHARGEFCVVYGTGDRPEPGQLREAVAAFRALPSWVVCVQAELRCSNPDTSWLTQFSAAELAVNLGLFLRGLGLATPLASTSNHFRVEALRRLGAWDPHNVTPGLDLGVRIPRRGWDVRMMASVTATEADARLSPWLTQRSRWIEGCYQTWLVHMRSPYRLWRDLGTTGFIGLQLTLALPVFTTLVTPLLWALILVYLVSGPGHSAAQFPLPVISLAVAAAALGNLLTVYALMIGCMEQGLLRAVRTMLLAPAYGALMSVAAYRALFQLFHPRLRHRWELAGPPHGEPAGPREGEPAGQHLVSGGNVIPS